MCKCDIILTTLASVNRGVRGNFANLKKVLSLSFKFCITGTAIYIGKMVFRKAQVIF